MKTNPSSSRSLALSALALAAAVSVSAQTVITPDLMAPPSAYDTSKPGFVLRAHQIFAARAPGDQNSIPNVLKELAGGFGPNRATNGPLPGGLWSETYLNHSTDWPLGPNDGDWYNFPGVWALPFPGINPNTAETGGFSTFAYEIVTYLNLPAGTNTLVVGSGDSFRLTIGVGDNPYSFAAVQASQFSGTRNYGLSLVDIDVQSAGVYPVRIIYGQGGGINGLQFYTTNRDTGAIYLINDPFGGGMELTSYQPASLPITPSLAYVSQLLPVPGDPGTSPIPTVQAQLNDGTSTTVNTNTITLSFDGSPVTPTITKTGNVTHVSYTVPNLLALLSTHTAEVVAQDSAANVLSNQWSFTVGSFTVVPASWAYPAGSGDVTKPGFAGKIHQARYNAVVAPSVLTADKQLAGQLIDGATGEPFINMVVTNGNPIIGAGWPANAQPADAGGGPSDARTFTANTINFSILDNSGSGAVAEAGNFSSANGYPDALWPGLPGSADNTFLVYTNAGEHAVEVIGWIELPAGLNRIGVTCNDTFELALSPNDGRDVFRTSLAKFEGNRSAVGTTATVFLETNGVYSFRLIFRNYRQTVPNQLEWFRYDETTGNPVLINDTVAGAVKSYRAVTVPTRPYVKSVTPAVGASGVEPTAPVSVVLVNLGTNIPVLKINDTPVTYTSVANGNEVTITYTPASPLSDTVNCEVTYGAAVGAWTYQVKSGRTALFVVASGGVPNVSETFLGNRLAQNFGLDVQYWNVSGMNNDTGLTNAQDKTLILISSTIASGDIAAWARNFMTNNPNYPTVPVITWEYGNADEWGFGSAGAGNANASLIVTNAPNPLTGELTNGVHAVYTSSGNDGNRLGATLTPGLILAAYSMDSVYAKIAGMDKGLVIDNYYNSGVTVTNGSRKVFLGLLGNNNAQNLTADGLALFDAAISWVLPPPPPKLTATPGPGAGQMTLSWTGSGTLETTTNLTAPVWIPAPSQANPQTLNATDPQRYYRVRQ
jgi:hypothetical protein